MRLRPPSARSPAPPPAAAQGTFGAARSAPVADAASQAIRANLVSQYNNIIAQITTTAQDASFNGINLLNGDDLKLTFNETGKSTLNIKGVTYNATGLGLAPLISGTDFLDNARPTRPSPRSAPPRSTLRSQASTLGSNLSIVQIRQDFSKNLINVLQTGSSNLTLADTNEEAANSQALSTRQSIAVSALALANQSQQSVLQLCADLGGNTRTVNGGGKPRRFLCCAAQPADVARFRTNSVNAANHILKARTYKSWAVSIPRYLQPQCHRGDECPRRPSLCPHVTNDRISSGNRGAGAAEGGTAATGCPANWPVRTRTSPGAAVQSPAVVDLHERGSRPTTIRSRSKFVRTSPISASSS